MRPPAMSETRLNKDMAATRRARWFREETPKTQAKILAAVRSMIPAQALRFTLLVPAGRAAITPCERRFRKTLMPRLRQTAVRAAKFHTTKTTSTEPEAIAQTSPKSMMGVFELQLAN